MREEERRRRPERPREEEMGEPRYQVMKIYPAGRGTYYGPREEPRYPAAQVSSFGRAEGEPKGMRGERRAWMEESRYPAGRGSYYTETSEKPSGTAGPESYFGRVEGEPKAMRERVETISVSFPAGTGTVYVRREEPQYPAEEVPSFGRVAGEPRERRMETIMITFPAGTGTVYAHREEPIYPPEEVPSFGRVAGEPRERRRERMEESRYPAGRGSYYTETSEKPSGTAGPESYFGRVEGEPMTREEMLRKRRRPE